MKTNALFDQCVENCDPSVIEEVERNIAIRNATLELIEAVEKYIRQETSRATLIWKKEKLKRLLEK